MKNEIAKKVAKKLLQINAIKLSPQNPFTWASGLLSPIYCDNRLTLSYPVIRDLIIKEGLNSIAGSAENIDSIAGVATAGIAHGAILAEYLNKPFLYVRSKAKAHGRQNSIEGKVKPGDKILVVEDLISTGKSSLRAVETLREADSIPYKVISIFSYGFSLANENFAKGNIAFESVCTFPELLEAAIEMEYINGHEKQLLNDWRASPLEWSQLRKNQKTKS